MFWTSAAVAAQSGRIPRNITSDEAIACIKNAVAAARSGPINEIDIHVRDGRQICEVEVVAPDGKKYEVLVDVAANKAARIEGD